MFQRNLADFHIIFKEKLVNWLKPLKLTSMIVSMNYVVIGVVVFWVINLKHVSIDLNVLKLVKQHINVMLKKIIFEEITQEELRREAFEIEFEKEKFLIVPNSAVLLLIRNEDF